MGPVFFEMDAEDQAEFLDGLIICAQIFWGPDLGFGRSVFETDLTGQLQALGRLLGGRAETQAGALAARLEEFQTPDQVREALEPEYVGLFVSRHGGIAAPLYQSFYESAEGLLMGPSAREMERRLAEAGLDLGDKSAEPPDHLSVEIEYLVLMLEKGLDDPDVEKEIRKFAAENMRPWVEKFTLKLADEPEGSFYRLAAGLVVEALNRAA